MEEPRLAAEQAALVKIQQDVEKAEAAIARAEEWLDKARRSELDVTDKERELFELKRKVALLRQNFLEGG